MAVELHYLIPSLDDTHRHILPLPCANNLFSVFLGEEKCRLLPLYLYINDSGIVAKIWPLIASESSDEQTEKFNYRISRETMAELHQSWRPDKISIMILTTLPNPPIIVEYRGGVEINEPFSPVEWFETNES